MATLEDAPPETGPVEFTSPLAWSIESSRLVEEAYRIDRAFEERLRALEAEVEQLRDENASVLAKDALIEELREENDTLTAQANLVPTLRQEKVGLQAQLDVLAPLAELLDNAWDAIGDA